MDLGLSIGRSEARLRGERSARSEQRLRRSGGGWEWAKEGNHPPLQLELNLSWPTDQLGSTHQPEPSSPLAAVATAAVVSAPTQSGEGAHGPVKAAGDHDSYNDAGPSSSTSRSGWRCSDEEGGGVGGPAPRKKLRLTKEQSCYLEESFKEQTTLNPKQKLAIAKKLNLRPRQVEVWFQNRRARTKLKQTEVEYEYMKRCCESLTEENRRLHREIQQLRALKAPGPHLRLHLPATTLSMCPSCERAAAKEMGGRKVGGTFATPLKLREACYPKMAYPVS